MAAGKATEKNPVVWSDRKHFMWFPFSFTVYELKKDRLYEKKGFFSTTYDELLLYRVLDITLNQTFGQKVFGTGTIILKCKADAASEIRLENIKNPLEVKEMFSEMIEEARNRHRIVGREFYGDDVYVGSGSDGPDGDDDLYDDMDFSPADNMEDR